jgi:hypothetical protein
VSTEPLRALVETPIVSVGLQFVCSYGLSMGARAVSAVRRAPVGNSGPSLALLG